MSEEPLDDPSPPEDFDDLISRHPIAALVGAVIVGVLIGRLAF